MRLTRSSGLLVALALFPLGLVACSGNTRPAYEVPVTVEDLTTAHIVNSNMYPVTVYLTRNGMQHRLGVVESNSAGLFLIPPHLLTGRRDFQMHASALGPHTSYVSETFRLEPGQTASWRVREASNRLVAAVSLVAVY